MADRERIRVSADSETWRITEDTRTRYVRLSYSDDLDCVLVVASDHKEPWVSTGERYESFLVAREAHGLPEVPRG